MSITHSESGQPNSVHSSGGAKELTGRSRGDYPVDGDGAVDALRPVYSPLTIASKNWGIAEEATHEIIQKVRPTSESEERRMEVIGYIQRLIRKYLGVEVLPYGSVPLKTYLPDGDIDLTAFGGANVEDLLVDDMKFVLEREEKNITAEFDVKDVQLIRAEVKLVKCIVQDIVVDVSFNQIGGLCTLCFLEQIDRLIGKDHLFKSSIILIKAWCYYESRILGAHHGLISTYALETLVLYIFHFYHSTLGGPLAVLYKFLDYFSKFDWETYCVSLNGPMCLSSLPAVRVEMPEDSDGNLLLTSDFLSSCIDMFSVPSRGGDQSSRGFQQKHLNIVDPLKETNNLGRSVSKGNFYRVRSAFTYGAKKLARILSEPENAIAHELHKFFANTMARNGSKQKPNIQNFDLSLTCNGSISMPPVSEICKSDNSTYGDHGEHTITSRDVLSHRISGDANDHATCGLGGLKISVDSSKSETPKLCYAPHLFFAKSKFQISAMKDGNQDSDKLEVMCESLDKNMSVQKDEVVAPPSIQRDFHVTHERVPLTNSETLESLNLLTDLTGDYDSYFQCLQYGRWCYEHSSGLHIPPPSSPKTVHQHNPFANRNDFSNQHRNGFHQSPSVYPMQHVLMPGVPFGWEEMPKPRGTGTYFPNMNQPPHGYRPSTITGMNKALPRPPFNNGQNMIFPQSSNIEKSIHEPSQSQVSVEKFVTVGSFNSYQSFSPRGSEYPNSNGFNVKLEGIPEFRPAGNASISDTSKQLKPAFSKDQDRNSLRNSYLLKDEDDFPPL